MGETSSTAAADLSPQTVAAPRRSWRGVRGRGHFAYLAGGGALGWLVLVIATALEGLHGVDPDAAMLFFVFCLIARLLSFEAMSGMSISLDSAFYIAAVWVEGPLAAAWIATAVLVVDRVRRAVVAARSAEGPHAPRAWTWLAIFGGPGLVGAQLYVAGHVVPVESAQLAALDFPTSVHGWLVGGVPLMTVAFLFLNYGLGGFSLWLQGHEGRPVASRLLRHGVLAECLQIPLSMLAIRIFLEPHHTFTFVLLGTTFLVMSAGMRRIHARDVALERRVAELSALNQLGRAMSHPLRADELLQKVAETARSLAPRAGSVTLGLRDDSRTHFVVRIYDGDGPPAEAALTPGHGLAARVLAYRTARHLTDLAVDRPQGERAIAPWEQGARSWLGVPLAVYDDVIGYVAVQSSAPGAFDDDVRRALESLAQQTAAALDNARLYGLATIDGLTRLYVRRYFEERLVEEWRRGQRHGHGLSLVLVDLDDFKAINDRHGHPVGDRVLREVGAIVRRSVREIDLPARFGGEEMALILPRTGPVEAAGVAERIRSELERSPIVADDVELSMTASFGVATQSDAEGPDALVRLADAALYQAKAAGKNRVVVHSAEETATLRPR